MKPLQVSPDVLRAKFAQALSTMYKAEMPRYREMSDLVAAVNAETRRTHPELGRERADAGEPTRLNLERHGAIRVGTAQELACVRRLFAAMGMFPVGYYNLSTAGIPVHSTAFRPIDDDALRRSPFRVFTSLLRLDLINDADLREQAAKIMSRRDILTPRCRALLDIRDRDDGLAETLADEFVSEAIETFRWRSAAATSAETYARLQSAHPLLADIVCFKGPHINHLTLTALDIDAAQGAMVARDLAPKPIIEGPPRRRCPILLRQTSFKALAEPISFADGASGLHMARFGEIEQRGAALTPSGRALYDRLLRDVYARVPLPASDPVGFQHALDRAFEAFPDDMDRLRREKLAYFRFVPAGGDRASTHAPSPPSSLEDLVACGFLRAEPILYEDFLPVSAAGIFRSNLAETEPGRAVEDDDRAGFEAALGAPVIDAQALYQEAERRSRASALQALGVHEIDPPATQM
jgi:uncharacterized glyoxalase superfamily metalloenzyme YdcJ